MFDSRQREVLLNLARNAIDSYLHSRTLPAPVDEFLNTPGCAFVTLKIGDELRGCIGSTDPSELIGSTVIRCAISSAFGDPRFPPLTKEEFPLIHIEISVLSQFEKVASPEEIIPGTHGVMITHLGHRGLLLPQVATQYNWDRETFLNYSCRKAGLPPDAWKDSATTIEKFTAEIFAENDSPKAEIKTD